MVEQSHVAPWYHPGPSAAAGASPGPSPVSSAPHSTKHDSEPLPTTTNILENDNEEAYDIVDNVLIPTVDHPPKLGRDSLLSSHPRKPVTRPGWTVLPLQGLQNRTNTHPTPYKLDPLRRTRLEPCAELDFFLVFFRSITLAIALDNLCLGWRRASVLNT